MRKTANKYSHFTVRVEIATLIYGGTTSNSTEELNFRTQEQGTRPGLFFRIAVDDKTTTLCSWRCVVVLTPLKKLTYKQIL